MAAAVLAVDKYSHEMPRLAHREQVGCVQQHLVLASTQALHALRRILGLFDRRHRRRWRKRRSPGIHRSRHQLRCKKVETQQTTETNVVGRF
jgi:hypothetical protein